MNLITASKMLELLEQSPPAHADDDAYFIIQRLLKTEVKKGEDLSAYTNARNEFDDATIQESIMCEVDKVKAIKMYRERTGHGLKEAKDRVEAGAQRLRIERAMLDQQPVGATSCG